MINSLPEENQNEISVLVRDQDDDPKRKEYFSVKAPVTFGFQILRDSTCYGSDIYETELRHDHEGSVNHSMVSSVYEIAADEQLMGEPTNNRESMAMDSWLSQEIGKIKNVQPNRKDSLPTIPEEIADSCLSNMMTTRTDKLQNVSRSHVQQAGSGIISAINSNANQTSKSGIHNYISHLEVGNNYVANVHSLGKSACIPVDDNQTKNSPRLTPTKYPYYKSNFVDRQKTSDSKNNKVESAKEIEQKTLRLDPEDNHSAIGREKSDISFFENEDKNYMMMREKHQSEIYAKEINKTSEFSKNPVRLSSTKKVGPIFSSFNVISQAELHSQASKRSDKGDINIDYRIDSFKHLEDAHLKGLSPKDLDQYLNSNKPGDLLIDSDSNKKLGVDVDSVPNNPAMGHRPSIEATQKLTVTPIEQANNSLLYNIGLAPMDFNASRNFAQNVVSVDLEPVGCQECNDRICSVGDLPGLDAHCDPDLPKSRNLHLPNEAFHKHAKTHYFDAQEIHKNFCSYDSSVKKLELSQFLKANGQEPGTISMSNDLASPCHKANPLTKSLGIFKDSQNNAINDPDPNLPSKWLKAKTSTKGKPEVAMLFIKDDNKSEPLNHGKPIKDQSSNFIPTQETNISDLKAKSQNDKAKSQTSFHREINGRILTPLVSLPTKNEEDNASNHKSSGSIKSHSRRSSSKNVADRLLQKGADYKAAKEKKQSQKFADEIAQCTFMPKINGGVESDSGSDFYKGFRKGAYNQPKQEVGSKKDSVVSKEKTSRSNVKRKASTILKTIQTTPNTDSQIPSNDLNRTMEHPKKSQRELFQGEQKPPKDSKSTKSISKEIIQRQSRKGLANILQRDPTPRRTRTPQNTSSLHNSRLNQIDLSASIQDDRRSRVSPYKTYDGTQSQIIYPTNRHSARIMPDRFSTKNLHNTTSSNILNRSQSRIERSRSRSTTKISMTNRSNTKALNYQSNPVMYRDNPTYCQPLVQPPAQVCESSNDILREKLLQEIYSALIVNNIIIEADESAIGDLKLDPQSVIKVMLTMHFITNRPSDSEMQLILKMFFFLDPSETGLVSTRSLTLFILAVFGISFDLEEHTELMIQETPDLRNCKFGDHLQQPHYQTSAKRNTLFNQPSPHGYSTDKRNSQRINFNTQPHNKTSIKNQYVISEPAEQADFNDGYEHGENMDLSRSNCTDNMCDYDENNDIVLDQKTIKKIQIYFAAFKRLKMSCDKQIKQNFQKARSDSQSKQEVNKLFGHYEDQMANNYRNKIWKKASKYINEGKLSLPRNETLSHIDFLTIEKRVREIELEEKRIEKENSQTFGCTFRPSINNNSMMSERNAINISSLSGTTQKMGERMNHMHKHIKRSEKTSKCLKLDIKISEGVVKQIFLTKEDTETIEQKVDRLVKEYGLDAKKAERLNNLLKNEYSMLA